MAKKVFIQKHNSTLIGKCFIIPNRNNPLDYRITFSRERVKPKRSWENWEDVIQGISGVTGGLLSGGMDTKVGNTLKTLSPALAAIPGIGPLVSAGANVLGGAINGLFGSKFNNGTISEIESQIGDLNSFTSNASDFDTLQSEYNTLGNDIGISASQIGKEGIFSNKVTNKARDLNNRLQLGNSMAMANIANNARNISNNTMDSLLGNYMKFGGNILTHGANFDTGITLIGNGGTHEENPNEGVQMGVDPEGTPNLVEEGEVIFDDYVFSNRLKVPKAVRQKYKLRGTKPLTFAEAAKQLSKESEERPNDPISKMGLEALMFKLALDQEGLKMANNKSNKLALGGKAHKYDGTSEPTQKLKTYRNYIQLAEDTDFYTPEYLRFWEYMNDLANINIANEWLNRINSGEFGNIGGNTFTLADIQRLSRDYKQGPVHNAYRAAAAQFAKDNPIEEIPERLTANRFFVRGKDGPTPLEFTPWEGWDNGTLNEQGQTFEEAHPELRFFGKQARPYDETTNTTYTDYYFDPVKIEPEKVEDKIEDQKAYKALPTWMRYSPIVGSAIGALTDALGLTNKPDYSAADSILKATSQTNDYSPVKANPIGNYLRYNPFDREFYINQLNAQSGATRRDILHNAGLNRGAGMAALLAADYNTQNQLGQLARQAEEYNLAQRQQVEDFNRATNMFNSESRLKADMANLEARKNKEALNIRSAMTAAEMKNQAKLTADTLKSANLSNLINSIGDVGRENMAWNWRNFALATGVPVGDSEAILLGNVGRENANGGKIKRKKKGLTY